MVWYLIALVLCMCTGLGTLIGTASLLEWLAKLPATDCVAVSANFTCATPAAAARVFTLVLTHSAHLCMQCRL